MNRAQRRAMGYRREPKIYKLSFADPEMDGLVVRARSVPLGTFLDVCVLAELIEGDHVELDTETVAAIRKLFDAFAAVLVDWNLETGDGDPVPPTAEGLQSQELDFVMEMVRAWVEAVAAVPDPLGRRSNGGEPFPAASLPMEPLSESQAS